MYQYLNDTNGDRVLDAVRRIEDGAIIPFDEKNRDYVAYQEWLSQNNLPIDA